MSLIVLDFDGTLADTSAAIVATFKAAAAENGFTCAPDAEIEKSIGLHLRDMFRDLCGITDREAIRRCIASYLVIFRRHFDKIRLFPGVLGTLKSLKEHGTVLAIATNRGEESLVPLMTQLGLDGLITAYVTPEGVDNVKPAPDMVLKLMSELGATPEDTLVVGDTTYDVDMGHAAGCRTCAVTYGSHDEAALRAVSPTYVAPRFADLLRFGA